VAGRQENEVLPFDRLHGIDVGVSLLADRVVGRGDFLAEQVDLAVKLEDGKLEIGPVKLEFQGGRYSGRANIDGRSDPPELSLLLLGLDLDLGTALAQVQKQPVATGTADLSLELECRGRSAEELLASLEGDASMAIHDGQLRVKHMGFIAQSVFRSLYDSARESLAGAARKIAPPFRRGSGTEDAADAETRPIQCFAADFGIVGGVASARVLALDTSDLVMVGSGQVDLVAKRYEIHVEPRNKRRSLFTVTVPLDIEGPLNRPEVTASLLGTTGATATSFFDNLTRPTADFLLPFVDDSVWSEKSCADLREELYH
jgi:uncharacterized protein involved in outer membrane biogenesis